jgi:Domain of unknown function (DUF4157)
MSSSEISSYELIEQGEHRVLAVKSPDFSKLKAETTLGCTKHKVETIDRAQASPLWHKLATHVQPKLTVSASDDPLELEADRVADQVMRMPDPSRNDKLSLSSVRSSTAQRKCTACEEEEEKLQRKENGGAVSAPATAPTIVHEALSASGQPLDTATRGFFEPRFGQDFNQVRVHTDAMAADSARAVNARAYTVGADIVFDAGRYQPYEAKGSQLLAHELAHVVQQGAAADRLQRFTAEEHVKIGDKVEPGQRINLSPEVGDATYGEMIALGDYFESVSEILTEANGVQFMVDEVKLALWKVNPSARQRPLVGQNVEDAVMARYYRLAAKNQTHFTKGSEPGKSNREQYIAMHQRAIGNAYSQAATGIIQGVSWQGWEGFAGHFLTDAFSGGHVRTPRHEIQAYWNGKYPRFTENLVDMICCYMASYINDIDNVGYVKTVGGLAEGIRPILLQKAGPALNAFAFGDLISKVLHDADNMGLEVRSQTSAGSGSGPFVWRDLGDGYLYLLPADATPQMKKAQQQTQQMVEEAVRRSFAEAKAAYGAGFKHAGDLDTQLNPANFKALELIPTEDLTLGNLIYDWKAKDIPSLDKTMQMMLRKAFMPGQEIGDQIRDLKVDCITTRSGFDLHTWHAWVCFRNMLLGGIIPTLDRIAKGETCPPGKDNPCGRINEPCP